MKNVLMTILLFTALFACEQTKEEEQEKEKTEEITDTEIILTAAQYQTAGIETGSTSIRNLSDVVTANGLIDIPPQNLVSISAPMGGFVRKTELLQGMKVKKGQLLAVMENPEFIQIQQDYLETQSKLDLAQLELKRQTELSKENINAQKILQQSASEVKIQKARLNGLTERLRTAGINMKTLEAGNIVNHASIYAPISGSVTTVNVNLGKYVNPTDVMFEIVDTDHLHVELSVFENDIQKVKLGQLVRFTVSNNPGKEHLAKVYLINQKINEDRTVRVHCHLTNEEHGMMPENFVKAIIETGANPVTALPDEAIVDYEGQSYIFLEKPKQSAKKSGTAFEMLQITKGVSENGFTEVQFPKDYENTKSGIVLKGAYTLLSKLKNTEEEE
ncbi:efflux RND transporter periplasmic adaptor subunit [Dyadobacter psychrotolerans]|uniref:Efflux RND transporter periplasmic adaptor subunit n=1 Tax=Dyadobacter psychrotolerans TaxID=2541721 RepID=A0A4R5DF77_9BACT|nr:efflux RND transporter periplasmic adaptor subunit [Dyadobacter psychrotolerans]TDE10531.1 efflux RND transporter periplasmic adaptor subunit [Dyadobacter psychrotolerans]